MRTHTESTRLPDHAVRMRRASFSLEGLAVGDAFGEAFFLPRDEALQRIAGRRPPDGPWRYTDDTQMAIGVVETLASYGHMDRDALAETFAQHYRENPCRGYGPATHDTLSRIAFGECWRTIAGDLFEGQGSFGNGAAMRSAPVGAYFAGDPPRIAAEACAGAQVTHAHPEGQIGAVAVSLAAGLAVTTPWIDAPQFLETVGEALPASQTRDGLLRARSLAPGTAAHEAARTLGNGSRTSAQDTVPFALWCAAQHLDDFEQALWLAVAGLGDRDTTCAIAGGIVALSATRRAIPIPWLTAREDLPRHVALY